MIRALLILLLLATPALALDPERREVVVVSGRVWDGHQFTEMFLPSDRPVMTVMAGGDSAIIFVRTLEYYWPLSRQVYVDFERRREPVAGLLRIERDGDLIAEIAAMPYAIDYPEGAANGNGRMLWGEEAIEGHAAYLQAERAFNRRFVEAQRAHTAYEQALLAAARAGSTDPVEAPPPLPEPDLRLVTPPSAGFRLALDPGTYRMALVADGKVVAGTERDLRVIPAAGSDVTVADVLPEERWTRPLASNAAEARIYARAGATFYLTLAEASRFRESDYLAVVAPQALALPGREVFVRRKPSAAADLEVTSPSGTQRLALGHFKVDQTSASGFGYTVRPARPGETPDIAAFSIAAPSGADGRLVLARPESGFSRQVVGVGPRNAILALLLAFLPLAGFGTVRLARRRGGSAPGAAAG